MLVWDEKQEMKGREKKGKVSLKKAVRRFGCLNYMRYVRLLAPLLCKKLLYFKLQPLCPTHERHNSHTNTQSSALVHIPSVWLLLAFRLLSYILLSTSAVRYAERQHGGQLGLAPSDCVHWGVLWPANNMFVY